MTKHFCRWLVLLLGFLPSIVAFASDPEKMSDKMVPVPMNWDSVQQTVFDLSGYLDAPAGKNGPIRVREDQFIKPDGTPFRPWGVNLKAEFFFPTKEMAVKIADDFARFGFTCVRFHSLDSWIEQGLFPNPANTLQWSEEKLDRFDFFVAELKKRGIYISFTLNAYRVFRKEDGIQDYDKMGFGKSTYYFDPNVQERCLEFSRKILTHKNPYTGVEYRKEPALFWVELLNENSLFEAWTFGRLVPKEDHTARQAWAPLTQHYANELHSQWNAWLASRVSVQTREAWARELGAEGPDVPLSHGKLWEKCSDEHFQTEFRFFFELEQRYFEKLKKFLREEIQIEALITGDADHNDWLSPYPHLAAFNCQGDFIDGHGYWDHVDYGPPMKSRNRPMVNDPLDSTIVQFARSPMKGKPFIIGETNTAFPHIYAGDHYPILTAYSLFQDWDGILWFEWGQGQAAGNKKRPDGQGLANDPVRFSNLILAGLMFHRCDVEKARQTVVRSMTREEAFDSLRWDRPTNRPYYTKGFATSTPLEHKVLWQFVDKDDSAHENNFPPPAPLGKICSDTGQLVWKDADKKLGIVTIDTPNTQGATGFHRSRTEKFEDIDLTIDSEFATVFVSSLDAHPIARADRLLLVAHGMYQSMGFEWEENGMTVKQIGSLPMQIQPISGTITVKSKNDCVRATITPLSGLGVPIAPPQTLSKTNNGFQITLPQEQVATWYLLEFSARAREQ